MRVEREKNRAENWKTVALIMGFIMLCMMFVMWRDSQGVYPKFIEFKKQHEDVKELVKRFTDRATYEMELEKLKRQLEIAVPGEVLLPDHRHDGIGGRVIAFPGVPE